MTAIDVSNECEFVEPRRVGNYFVTEAMEAFANRLDEEEKRILLMGPVVAFIAEHKPYVATVPSSFALRLLGASDKVVRMRDPDLNGNDIRAAQHLTMLGLFSEGPAELRYDIDVEPDDADKLELELLRSSRAGYASQKTWRWTAKGAAIAELLKPHHSNGL